MRANPNIAQLNHLSTTPKILIMAGGTGGHVFPALAVAEHLQKLGVEVHWMGTSRGIEANIIPANNIPLHLIDVAGLRGKSLISLLKGPFIVAKAVMQARHMIKSVKPNVVLGMGGYASGPGGVAARLQGIPLIIHEQNATPGSTNKILAKLAQRVLCGFPDALPKSRFVGNPVRDAFYSQLLPNERFNHASESLNVLILGGSLGARALNEVVPAALALLPESTALNIVHQSGTRTHAQAIAGYESLKKDRPMFSIELSQFIDDVAQQIAKADLVICRAGALTIAELAAVGAASILVPFPYAIDDHQTANARWLSDKGAAILLPETQLTAQSLAKQLQQLFFNEAKVNKTKLNEMANLALAQSDQPKRDSLISEQYKEQTATQKVSGYCAEYLNV